MELVRRVHRGSHLRAPSEAANIIILRPGQGKDTFSSSSHQLCLTRLAVTKKEKVMRSTSTKARQRPQRRGNFFWSGLTRSLLIASPVMMRLRPDLSFVDAEMIFQFWSRKIVIYYLSSDRLYADITATMNPPDRTWKNTTHAKAVLRAGEWSVLISTYPGFTPASKGLRSPFIMSHNIYYVKSNMLV